MFRVFCSRAVSGAANLWGRLGGSHRLSDADGSVAVVGAEAVVSPSSCGALDSLSLTEAMRGPVKFGTVISLFFLCGFCVWAGFAPLSGSVVAAGQVSFGDVSKQYIQVVDGGQVREVLVKEGDHVARGQVLVRMYDVETAASAKILQSSIFSLEVASIRLQAELGEKEELDIPDHMLHMADGSAELENILANQRHMFDVRTAVRKGKRSLLEQNKVTIDHEIAGLHDQLGEEKKRLSYLDAELEGLRDLVRQEYAPRNRLLEVEGRRSAIMQKISSYDTNVSKLKEELMAIDIKLLNLSYDNAHELERDLLAVRDKLIELGEKRKVAERSLALSTIVAPIDGTINNMRPLFEGSMARPGESIMEVVPPVQDLVVEAHLPRDSIDSILGNLQDINNYGGDGNLVEAKVRLPAYSGRWRRPLRAVVTYVAADAEPMATSPAGSMARTYLIRLRILDEELKSFPDVRLYPGMSAEVFVITGSRTMLSYLFEPVLGILRHSMSE